MPMNPSDPEPRNPNTNYSRSTCPSAASPKADSTDVLVLQPGVSRLAQVGLRFDHFEPPPGCGTWAAATAALLSLWGAVKLELTGLTARQQDLLEDFRHFVATVEREDASFGERLISQFSARQFSSTAPAGLASSTPDSLTSPSTAAGTFTPGSTAAGRHPPGPGPLQAATLEASAELLYSQARRLDEVIAEIGARWRAIIGAGNQGAAIWAARDRELSFAEALNEVAALFDDLNALLNRFAGYQRTLDELYWHLEGVARHFLGRLVEWQLVLPAGVLAPGMMMLFKELLAGLQQMFITADVTLAALIGGLGGWHADLDTIASFDGGITVITEQARDNLQQFLFGEATPIHPLVPLAPEESGDLDAYYRTGWGANSLRRHYPELAEALREHPEARILAADRTQVVVATGPVESARALVTVVPGVSSREPAGMPEYFNRTQQVISRAPAGTVGIMWLGYDAPPSALAAGPAEPRIAGGEKLRAFQAELDRRNPSAKKIVVAHSFGTAVTSEALRGGAAIDHVVLLGSPGVPGRHLPPGSHEVHGTHDPVTLVAEHTEFSGNFEYAPEQMSDVGHLQIVGGHSSYWTSPQVAELVGELTRE